MEKLKQIIAFRNKRVDEHIEEIIQSLSKSDKK